MILWLIALVTLACVSLVGYYQGAVRAAFSFLGLFAAALLAGPLGSLLHSLLPIFGLKNPLLIAYLAPVIGFLVVLTAFKCAAFAVHKKVEGWYKYKANETQRLLWERLNTRLGIPLGLSNGVVYVLGIGTLLYSIGYLTVQAATSDEDSWALRLVNRLNTDLSRTRLDKAVAPFMPKSELYYDAADVIVDIFQTPLLQNRLANYPALLTLGEKPEFKPLSDAAFQAAWIKGMTFGSFINHEPVKPLVENHQILTNVLALLGGDLKDLKIYLDTGKSPKFDDERILGRWAFDARASLNRARKLNPNMGSAEFTRIKKRMGTDFLRSTLTATVDNKAILLRPSAGANGVTQGTWTSTGDGKYRFTVREGGKKLELEVAIDGRNLIFTKDDLVLVFENTRV